MPTAPPTPTPPDWLVAAVNWGLALAAGLAAAAYLVWNFALDRSARHRAKLAAADRLTAGARALRTEAGRYGFVELPTGGGFFAGGTLYFARAVATPRSEWEPAEFAYWLASGGLARPDAAPAGRIAVVVVAPDSPCATREAPAVAGPAVAGPAAEEADGRTFTVMKREDDQFVVREQFPDREDAEVAVIPPSRSEPSYRPGLTYSVLFGAALGAGAETAAAPPPPPPAAFRLRTPSTARRLRDA